MLFHSMVGCNGRWYDMISEASYKKESFVFAFLGVKVDFRNTLKLHETFGSGNRIVSRSTMQHKHKLIHSHCVLFREYFGLSNVFMLRRGRYNQLSPGHGVSPVSSKRQASQPRLKQTPEA